MGFRRGESAEKLALWRRQAEEGDARAMHRVAEIARRAPETYDEAERWWLVLAEHGDTKAMSGLAALAGKRDDLAAVEVWLLRGAQAGSYGAMADLVRLYHLLGRGEEATPWEKALDEMPDLYPAPDA